MREIPPKPRSVRSLASDQPIHSKVFLKKVTDQNNKYERKWKGKNQGFGPQKGMLKFQTYLKKWI